MSLGDHLSRPAVAGRLQRPTLGRGGQPHGPLLGLASDGVYMCLCCYQQSGSLLHCLSTLTRKKRAVYFCCTGLGVTSTGRYPASCPMKPGLSSPGAFRHRQPRSPVLLVYFHFSTIYEICKLFFPYIQNYPLGNCHETACADCTGYIETVPYPAAH